MTENQNKPKVCQPCVGRARVFELSSENFVTEKNMTRFASDYRTLVLPAQG
jgi:hypothetical protein